MAEIEFIKKNDGQVLKMTKSDTHQSFLFQGEEYSINMLEQASVIKVYEDEYHDKSFFRKDCYGRLFLYTYREEIGFGDDDDRTDETYCLVKDEQDAENMKENSNPIWGRIPYIYVSETGFVSVHEYVEN